MNQRRQTHRASAYESDSAMAIISRLASLKLTDLSILEGEVFGPILHVIRYKAGDLDKVMDAIIKTGYGLTLGIHSRIDATYNIL